VGWIPSGKCPMNLTRTHRIDEHPLATHQIEDREIRAGFLREADRVPCREVAATLANDGGVIHVQRRAMITDHVRNAHSGDRTANEAVFLIHGGAA